MPARAPVTANLLSIGDELVSGLTVDTNSAHAAQRLATAGVVVQRHLTLGDHQPTLETAVRDLATQCDLLLITGGIGPTPDDLTREAVAAVVDDELASDENWVERIRQIWSKRGRTMPESNRKQATYPKSGQLLDNPIGTAGGVGVTIGECQVFVLPGVPREFKAMLDLHVLPWASEQTKQRGGAIVMTRAIHTFGRGESDIAEALHDLLARNDDPQLDVGTTASAAVVSVRAYARAVDEEHAKRLLDRVESVCRDTLGDAVFGTDDTTLPMAVMQLLQQHRTRLATAESCTGGLVAKMITDLPGSSDVFHRGLVTYANEAKTEQLGVPEAMLIEHGAVSEPVAGAMAEGARRNDPSSGVAVAITGIAGPGGGSDEKPVGTVCFGLAATGREPFTRKLHLHGNRDMVRQRAALTALDMVRRHLLSR